MKESYWNDYCRICGYKRGEFNKNCPACKGSYAGFVVLGITFIIILIAGTIAFIN